MEVGHEPVNDLKTVSRGNENIGFRRGRGQRALRAVSATRGGLSGGDLVNQRLRQLIPFTMHLVLGEIVDPHRPEGAGAYVQRQRCAPYAMRFERFKCSVVKV